MTYETLIDHPQTEIEHRPSPRHQNIVLRNSIRLGIITGINTEEKASASGHNLNETRITQAKMPKDFDKSPADFPSVSITVP